MAKWQQRYRIDWDANDGRNGGAQRTFCEILSEMERFKSRAEEEDLGAVALVLDLAKAFERVSLLVMWAWATHFSFPSKILRVLCRYFEHQRPSAVRRMCGGTAPDHHGHLVRVKVVYFSTHCAAGRTV